MKRVIYGGIVIAIALVIILILRSIAFDTTPGTDFAYHVLLSGTDDYKAGVYTENFDLTAGDYAIRFIASGSSPKQITINLKGETLSFLENYKLQNMLHKSPISEYYTWSYNGTKMIHNSQGQIVEITIDPHGKTDGSVSILLERR
ncbi:MAG: hypothetical protein K8823_146 [Cenarchaeum symbiont of Oopsacas minuta]|nr:hypothetical protein [Cenarchaeum symbiont of Oopsacas minuta]